MKCEKRDGRREFEKNWGMFCVGEKLYAIYSISPFVVLCIDFIDGLALASPVACHIWDSKEVESQYGELHGGAAPVIIGDLGYYVAQAKSDSVAGPIYRGTVLTFEAKPPFRPVAVAPRPLFTLSIDEMRAMPEARLNPTVTQCFYPCGALYDETDASITISYGINDYRAGCRNYDLSRLEKSLRPVRLLTQSSSLSS